MKKQVFIIFSILLLNYSISSATSPDIGILDCNYSAGYTVTSYFEPTLINPEIHIFGIYEARPDYSSGSHPPGNANVYVERKGIPLIIVLSSYEPVFWKIHKGDGVNITHIILNGYHPQEIEGAAGIQVINRSGVGNYIIDTSFKWLSARTQVLVSEIENDFNRPIKSYHGCYDASIFKITGEVVLPTYNNLSFINLLLKHE